MCPWHAIRTRARAEQAVADRIAAHDLDTFVPRYLEPVRWSDRLHRTWRPLFPGYLFARFHAGEAEIVTHTAGVAQILGPETIPDSQIESLRIACAASPQFTPVMYRPGDPVRIESGPFAGCEGIVDRMPRPNRLTLKIDLLKRAVSVEIDAKTVVRPAR